MFALRRVEIANADQRHGRRVERRRVTADLRERAIAVPEQMRHRHPVHIAAARRRRCIAVPVRVEPDHAHPLAASAQGCRSTRDRAGRDRVIAPQHQRLGPVAHGRFGAGGEVATHLGDRAEVPRPALGTALGIFAEGDRHVSGVFHGVADCGEPLPQVGVSDGKRAHIDPAPRGPEVHRRTDDSNRRWCVHSGHPTDGTAEGKGCAYLCVTSLPDAHGAA